MKREERKQRLSLTLLFAAVILIVLLVSTLLLGLIVVWLVRRGILQLGATEIKTGGLLLRMIFWSLVVGSVLSFLAVRYPFRPVNEIMGALNRLAAGDFSVRLSPRGLWAKYPALRRLSDSFNKTAEELGNTELLRADFVNNFSHEFKTPIVSIAGFAKLLRKGNLSLEEQTEYLKIIEEESLRLSAMATKVLELTQVENQAILTDIAPYNLSEQIRGCIVLLEDKWSQKHLELMLDFDEHTIVASEGLMKQVWMNLLDNAVKFTPEYGIVKVNMAEEGSSVQVTVTNSGSVIAPEDRERIFQKFYQADTSHAAEGNGIGLAVVKKIVELHGGSVRAESGEDRTSFIVTLQKERTVQAE